MYLWRLHLCVQPCCVCEQSPCVHQLWGCPENLDPPVGWSWWLGTKKGRQVHQKCDGGNVKTNTHREHMLAPAHAQAKSKKKTTQRTQKCGIHHSMINDRIHGDGSHKHLLLLAINAQWPWQVKKGGEKKRESSLDVRLSLKWLNVFVLSHTSVKTSNLRSVVGTNGGAVTPKCLRSLRDSTHTLFFFKAQRGQTWPTGMIEIISHRWLRNKNKGRFPPTLAHQSTHFHYRVYMSARLAFCSLREMSAGCCEQ